MDGEQSDKQGALPQLTGTEDSGAAVRAHQQGLDTRHALIEAILASKQLPEQSLLRRLPAMCRAGHGKAILAQAREAAMRFSGPLTRRLNAQIIALIVKNTDPSLIEAAARITAWGSRDPNPYVNCVADQPQGCFPLAAAAPRLAK